MQPLSNNELLRRFNRGKENARNAVYDRYHDALLIMTTKMTSDPFSGEDLVNDTFEVFYKESRTFDNLSDMRDLLFQIARKKSINYLKKQESDQKKHAEFEARHQYQDEDFYADINFSDTMALLFKSVEALPEKLKIVFRLRHFQDLSTEVVAEQLNISGKTVANRYSEAKQKLRWDLKRNQGFTIYLLNLFL
jgi:RNA polymerase sigma factor (sigma-70 family)